MKVNKLLIALGMAAFAFTACESEFKEDVKLDVQVSTNDDIEFDGQTITVKKGTPVQFNLKGQPDFVTFYSGERGNKYEYRERTQIDPNEIESSKLTFTLDVKDGDPKNILSMHISDEFPGIQLGNYIADSTLVEDFAWKDLIKKEEFPEKAITAKLYEVDLASYLGKRIVMGIRYKGQNNVLAQSKFTFNNMTIVNKLKDGTSIAIPAVDFGYTPLNMMHRWKLEDQTAMTSNRAYGFMTNNTSGIWNSNNWNAFYIHSSKKNAPLKYSWLVSSHIVTNACDPDKGVAVKNITQGLDTYTYTYDQEGTYTATFVGINYNQAESSSVVKTYTVVVK